MLRRISCWRASAIACLPRLKLPEHFRIGDDGVLDDFGESLIELASGQSFQNINDHQSRAMADALRRSNFFHRAVFTPVFPPIELSTIASSVVGI